MDNSAIFVSTARPALDAETTRNWWHRLRDWLWGYDFFISYHWASGGVYAVNLAQMLRSKGFDVFLDRADYASGDDWKRMGQIALRNTQRLVLVATREAVTMSRPVQHEVEIFTARGRQVIPIIFEDRFADLDRSTYPTLVRLPDSQLFIDSRADSLSKGPNPETVDELIRTHKVLRKRNLRALLTLIPAIIVVLFAAFATYQWRDARIAESNAVLSRDAEFIAKKQALTSRDVAESQLASNFFAQSRESSERQDWRTALLLACKAGEKAPQNDRRLPAYLDRIFRIVSSCPNHIVNLPISSAIDDATFSDNLDRLAVSTINGEIRVFDLRHAALLPMPEAITIADDSKKFPPRFSLLGDRVLAATAWTFPEQPDPDEPATPAVLKVWNCDDGTLYTTLADTHSPWEDLPVSYFRAPQSFPTFSPDGRAVLNISNHGGDIHTLWHQDGKVSLNLGTEYATSDNGKLPPVVQSELGMSRNPDRPYAIRINTVPGAGGTGRVDIVDTRSGTSKFSDDSSIEISGTVTSAALSRNAESLAVAWFNDSKSRVQRFDVRGEKPSPLETPIEIHHNFTTDAVAVLKYLAMDSEGRRALVVRYYHVIGEADTTSYHGLFVVDFTTGNAVPLNINQSQSTHPEIGSISDDGCVVLMASNLQDDSKSIAAWKSEAVLAEWRIALPRVVRVSTDNSRVLSVDSEGTVMSWPVVPVAKRTDRLSSAGLENAAWSHDGRKLLTVAYDGQLQMWHVAENENPQALWNKVVESGSDKVFFDRSGKRVVVAAQGVMYCFESDTGISSFRPIERVRLKSDDYDLKDVAIEREGQRFVYVCEQNVDDLNVFAAAGKFSPLEWLTFEAGLTRYNFLALMGDGDFVLKGNPFQKVISPIDVRRVESDDHVITLNFPENARMSGSCMMTLLKASHISAITNDELRVTLSNGPEISFSRNQIGETTCRVLPCRSPLSSPKSKEFDFNSLFTLSKDGRLLAAANDARVQIFEAASGDPLSEPLTFANTVRALSFTENASDLRVVDASGTLSLVMIHVDWKGKPDWIPLLAEGLTGWRFDDDQRIIRMSAPDALNAREGLLRQLRTDANQIPAAASILARLESSSNVPSSGSSTRIEAKE